ncbi:MAG: hypothetical protein GY946_09450 [bacterium]|nr:hypothetical protein [bacterium]
MNPQETLEDRLSEHLEQRASSIEVDRTRVDPRLVSFDRLGTTPVQSDRRWVFVAACSVLILVGAAGLWAIRGRGDRDAAVGTEDADTGKMSVLVYTDHKVARFVEIWVDPAFGPYDPSAAMSWQTSSGEGVVCLEADSQEQAQHLRSVVDQLGGVPRWATNLRTIQGGCQHEWEADGSPKFGVGEMGELQVSVAPSATAEELARIDEWISHSPSVESAIYFEVAPSFQSLHEPLQMDPSWVVGDSVRRGAFHLTLRGPSEAAPVAIALESLSGVESVFVNLEAEFSFEVVLTAEASSYGQITDDDLPDRTGVAWRVEGARIVSGSSWPDRSLPDEVCLEALPGVSPEDADQMAEAIAAMREVASVTQADGPCESTMEITR